MNNEPVGYIPDIALPTLTKEKSYCVINATKLDESDIPLYTHPVKELTNAEIAEVYEKCEWASGYVYWKEFARAILRKVQEK